MKRLQLIKSISLVAVLATVLVGCTTDRTRDDKVSAIINKIDSPFLVVNSIPGDLIEKSGALDGALPFTQEMLLGFFIDEEVTGVDYNTEIQIVVGKGPSFAPNFYGIFKLKNEAAFVELLETEANAEVQEKDGFHYVIKESDLYVIVWNEEFVVASNIPIDFAAMLGGGSSNQGMKVVDENIALIKAGDEGEINADYQTFLKNESDIAVHFIGEGLYDYMVEMSMGESEELEANKDMIEGVNTDLFLNFNNGQIDLQVLNDLSDEVSEKIGFLRDNAINSDLMAFGNSTDPIFSMAYNVDLEKVLDFSKEQMSTYDYEDLDKEIDNMGLTTEQAKTALSGEILFVLDHIEMEEEIIDWGYGEPYTVTNPVPVFGLVAGVNDNSVFTAMMEDAEVISEGIVKKGDAYIVLMDDILFSSNDSLWASKVASGNGSVVNDPSGMLSANPFGMYLNMEVLAELNALEGMEVFGEIMKNIEGGGNLDEQNVSFIFKDATKNSLRSLTEAVSNVMNGGQEGEDYEVLEAELEEAAEALSEIEE